MVQISDDDFIDMLWERVANFKPAHSLPDDFWEGVFDMLKDQGWFNGATPAKIVDNIAVNGEIKTIDEIRQEYDIPNANDMTDNELGRLLVNDLDWGKIGSMYVRHLGI